MPLDRAAFIFQHRRHPGRKRARGLAMRGGTKESDNAILLLSRVELPADYVKGRGVLSHLEGIR
jgi:hypothetical protein